MGRGAPRRLGPSDRRRLSSRPAVPVLAVGGAWHRTIPLPTLNLEGPVDLWSAARAVARSWRRRSVNESAGLSGAAATGVDAVVNFEGHDRLDDAARCLWLLSLELDEVLERSVGTEPDGHPEQIRRTTQAIETLLSSWQRRGPGDAGELSWTWRAASQDLMELLSTWPCPR